MIGSGDRALDGGEYLASDIAFKAADDLGFAQTLHGAASHVGPGSGIIAESDHNDAIESSVGLTMAAAGKSMPIGLT